jgi:hypothetical protein
VSGGLYAALSCLQGRRADHAAAELVDAGVSGIQLTAGCAPAPPGALDAAVAGLPTRTHHGYTPAALRRTVWSGADLVGAADSVHPPRSEHRDGFFARLEAGQYARTGGAVAFETMYGGFTLGNGADLRRYIDTGAPLAVDISHLHIQRTDKVLGDTDLAAVFDYPNISEVHVSAMRDGRDAHEPFTADLWGLDWARDWARRSNGVLVVECYVHRMSPSELQAQFSMLKEH